MKTKIDHRKRYFIMLDDETCPLDRTVEEVDAHNMFAYDIGFCVCDKYNNIYEEYSFVVKEIFFGEIELMKSSYYANKLPKYYEDIKNGKRKIASLYEIREAIKDCMERYNTNIIVGHNSYFDYTSIQNTQRWLTKSKYRYFFPSGTILMDTLKMARDTIGKQKSYISYCENNGYVTKNGKPRLTAEILYRYFTGNEDFCEEHQGLDDCRIQVKILNQCYRQHKPMRKYLFG